MEYLKRSVVGFDIDQNRLMQLKNGIDITKEVLIEDLQKIKNIEFTNNTESLIEADVFIVTVPSPIDENNNPNFNFIIDATKTVGKAIKDRSNLLSKDQMFETIPIIIYESTVYPGATEEICVKILERESGLEFNSEVSGKGFFLAVIVQKELTQVIQSINYQIL